MKKIIALLFTSIYLVFSIGSLRAEVTLLENKESQENIFSVKQSEESAASHFSETPTPKKSAGRSLDDKFVSEEKIQPDFSAPGVRLFLKHCNFRR